MARGSNSLRGLIKTGFGLSIGLMLGQILFILLGLAFFVPGYMLYMKDKKSPDSTNKILSIALMVIGVIIMGGLGFGFLLDNMSDMFGE
jgi:predicted transporter